MPPAASTPRKLKGMYLRKSEGKDRENTNA